jgi:ASC-1-like (ASCH) protein
MTHALKTWPEYFQLIREGKKRYELRENDREFKEGDKIILQEYKPDEKKYTGEEETFQAGFILHGPAFGLKKGYCIIQLEEPLYQ